MFDNYEETDFTQYMWENLYDVVDCSSFSDQDAELIYKSLESRLRFISFGDYLKRYIYRQAGLSEAFNEVALSEYQEIIMDSFSDTGTPASFESKTLKISAAAKKWLTQQTVKRKVVFLLGFGLCMSVKDVNDFLTKALREQQINVKDPFEVICWYCFKHGYGYPKFKKLWEIYQETPAGSVNLELMYGDLTIGARNTLYNINSDIALMSFLSDLKTLDNVSKQSATCKMYFDQLLTRSKEVALAFYDDDTKTAEEISEADLEHIISATIPKDKHGNLTPSKKSKLHDQFDGKRFSRQHINEVMAGKSEVTRFDLITLNFFIYSQTLDAYTSINKRYASFVESTNLMLEKCGLGQLYITNPYECFVLMCILSEDPLCTYADVWEMSYIEN